MNSRKLVEAAFKKEKTDRIPVNHRGFSSRAASHILGREAYVGGGIQMWREAKSLWEGWHDEYLERSYRDAIDLAFATGQDIVRSSYWRKPEKPTGKVDEYTYLYEYGEESNWRALTYYPDSEQANFRFLHNEALSPPDIRQKVEQGEKAAAAYEPGEEKFSSEIRAQKQYGDEKAVEISAVSVGIPIREASAWMEVMLTDPGLVRAHVSHQAYKARKNIEFLVKYGFEYFLGGLDFASEQGPMFSPKLFRELILPGLAEVSAACRGHGVSHLFASDGNLWPVSDMLFSESGIDGYYEIDRKAGMDLAEIRQRYPGLTLLGNISSWTLSSGSEEDVEAEVRSCIETAEKYGGIIVGVSNYVMPETPPGNIDAMLDLLR